MIKKRAEVLVVAIKVEVVDQPAGWHDPRVGIAVGVAAFLGAKQLGLFLRATHEQHPFGAGEPGQVLVGDVVFALSLGEIHPRDGVVASKPVHRCAERVGDLDQWRGRGDGQPQSSMHIAHQASWVLQSRHIDIAEHAVDALDVENHMFGQDIINRARYGHHKAPIGRAASQANQPRYAVHTPDRSAGHGLNPVRPEPHTPS